jgi:uncharacterized membrane protein
VISALIVALGIGFVAGLRSMTAPAALAWGAHVGWMNLSGSPLASLASRWSVILFSIFALGELIADLRPATPARTAVLPLITRIVVGLLTGASVAVTGGFLLWYGAVGGAIGAIAGTVGGDWARTGLVRALHVPDMAIRIPEDVLAIGLGLPLVSRF